MSAWGLGVVESECSSKSLLTWKVLGEKGENQEERTSWDQAAVSSQGLPGPGFIHLTPSALQPPSSLSENLVIVTCGSLSLCQTGRLTFLTGTVQEQAPSKARPQCFPINCITHLQVNLVENLFCHWTDATKLEVKWKPLAKASEFHCRKSNLQMMCYFICTCLTLTPVAGRWSLPSVLFELNNMCLRKHPNHL